MKLLKENNMTMISQTDLKRIETKLDMIIQYFNIGTKPRKSKRDIDTMVDKILLDVMEKGKKG